VQNVESAGIGGRTATGSSRKYRDLVGRGSKAREQFLGANIIVPLLEGIYETRTPELNVLWEFVQGHSEHDFLLEAFAFTYMLFLLWQEIIPPLQDVLHEGGELAIPGMLLIAPLLQSHGILIRDTVLETLPMLELFLTTGRLEFIEA
jgi:hypothetical protein